MMLPAAQRLRNDRITAAGEIDHGAKVILQLRMIGPLRVGARVRQTRKAMGWRGQVDVTVTEFVPDERLTLATDDGTTPGVRQSYQLTSEGDGCRVNYQLALDGVPKVFEPLVRAQLHHQVPRMLRRLGEMAAATAARS